MTNPPRTLEEARKRRYGVQPWLPDGYPYLEGNCAHEITKYRLQCARNPGPGHGPANLYCKQHAKMLERGKG